MPVEHEADACASGFSAQVTREERAVRRPHTGRHHNLRRGEWAGFLLRPLRPKPLRPDLPLLRLVRPVRLVRRNARRPPHTSIARVSIGGLRSCACRRHCPFRCTHCLWPGCADAAAGNASMQSARHPHARPPPPPCSVRPPVHAPAPVETQINNIPEHDDIPAHVSVGGRAEAPRSCADNARLLRAQAARTAFSRRHWSQKNATLPPPSPSSGACNHKGDLPWDDRRPPYMPEALAPNVTQ